MKWNEFQNLVLIKQAMLKKAYIKTGVNFEKKWSEVRDSLILSPEFIGENMPTWEGLQKRFNREMKDVLDRLGISAEGANLSGFGDESPLGEYEKMICQMAHEVHTKESYKSEEKLKKAKVQKSLLTHEKSALLEQGRLQNPALLQPEAQSPVNTTEMAAVNSKELNHSGSGQSTSSAFTTPHESSGTKKNRMKRKRIRGPSFMEVFGAELTSTLKVYAYKEG